MADRQPALAWMTDPGLDSEDPPGPVKARITDTSDSCSYLDSLVRRVSARSLVHRVYVCPGSPCIGMPWFSVHGHPGSCPGSKSGFDAVAQSYVDLASHVSAYRFSVELG